MSRGLVVAGLVLGLALPGQATLIDRGGGFIYDDVLDITWTQNAGLSGSDTWDNQVAWADQLSLVDSVRNVTWDDWRLASMSVSSGLPTGSAASVVDCSTATELACRDNELGYMFYQNLGGNFGDNLAGNQGLFTNIAPIYWSGSAFAPDPFSAWRFIFLNGSQLALLKDFNRFGWAVRSGDVGSATPAIPEPSTMLLMGSGVVGLMGWQWLRRGRS
jgi:hypothetical protein